ncbi:hypothetical protein TTHERM_00384670 (macronuclear) [Tetrahymena thermophila SB210]|uniref:Uncharacterized protein n=1 Tax=Tetrahymena thermophila (strain SB210) TaxID=312017 RepID=Q23RM5_TETTS|nr:hypothetical protein TTHERM_00384670 [Tetrahymena thermophila SB210]EAR99023.1 hypothetical protein TTHERM_00384670 [Tetrahymena thermophila SB210]|eukprot:XP_001019268.1 hypothetical protein TTHERM_00384670 [Tetrahymena thermophila SB210]
MNQIINDNTKHEKLQNQSKYNISIQKITLNGDETGKTTLFSYNNQKTANTISISSYNQGSKSSLEGKSSIANQSITPKDYSNDNIKCISNQATFSQAIANQSKQGSCFEIQQMQKKSNSYIDELDQLESDSVQERDYNNSQTDDLESSQDSFIHNVWQNADDDLILRGVDVESWRDKQGNPFNIFNLYKARSGQFKTNRQNLSNQLVCKSIQRLYNSYSKERCLQEQFQGINKSDKLNSSSNSPSKRKNVITFSEFLQINPFKDMNDYTQSGYNNIVFDRFKEYYQKYRATQMKKYNYSPERLEKQKSVSQNMISANDLEANKTIFGGKFVRSKTKKRTVDVFNSPESKPTQVFPQNQNKFQLNNTQKTKFHSSNDLDLKCEFDNEKDKKQINTTTIKNQSQLIQKQSIQYSQNNILPIQQLAAQQNQNLINKIFKEYSEQQVSNEDKLSNTQQKFPEIQNQTHVDYLDGLPLNTLKHKIETMQKLVDQQKQKLLQQKQQEYYRQNQIYEEILAPLKEERGIEQLQVTQKQISIAQRNSFNKSKSQEELQQTPLINLEIDSNNKYQKSRQFNQSKSYLNENLCVSPQRKSSGRLSNKSPINYKVQIKQFTSNTKQQAEATKVFQKEEINYNESQKSQNFESPLKKQAQEKGLSPLYDKFINSQQINKTQNLKQQQEKEQQIHQEGNQFFKQQQSSQLLDRKQNLKNQLLQTFNTQRSSQEFITDKAFQNQRQPTNLIQTQQFLLKQSLKPQIINYNFQNQQLQPNSGKQIEDVSTKNVQEGLQNASNLNQQNNQQQDFSKYYNSYIHRDSKQYQQLNSNKVLNVSIDTTPPANISTQDQSPLFFLNKNKQQMSLNKNQTQRIIQKIYNNNNLSQNIQNSLTQITQEQPKAKQNENQLSQGNLQNKESKIQTINNYYIPLQTDQSRLYKDNSNFSISTTNISNTNQTQSNRERQINEQKQLKNNISKSYFKNTIQKFNFSYDFNTPKIKTNDISQLENANQSLNSVEQLSPLKKRMIKEDMLLNKQSSNLVVNQIDNNNSNQKINQRSELRILEPNNNLAEIKEQQNDPQQFLLKQIPSIISKTNRQQSQFQIEKKQLAQDFKNTQSNNSLLIKSGFQSTSANNFLQEKRDHFQKTLQAIYNNKTFNK